MKNITTGIDRLVQLVNERGKLSSEEAAKELGLGKEVVEDWVELLEQEKIVTVTYKLSKMFIEERKIDEDTVVKAGKEVYSQRDAFNRKIDAAIKSIEKDTDGFEDMRKEFLTIQSRIKDEIETVRKEMKELDHYDDLKTHIDKDIEQQKKTYQEFIRSYESQLEEFDRLYETSMDDLKEEEKKLQEFQNNIAVLKNQKQEVESTVARSIDELKKVSGDLNEQLNNIQGTEKRILKIQHGLETLSAKAAGDKEKMITVLAKKVGGKREEIEKTQDALLKNAKLKVQEIRNYADTGRKIYESFSAKFLKKIKTDDFIKSIEEEKISLLKELEDMKQKVAVFSIASKSIHEKDQLGDIEKTLESYENRKNKLIEKINDLLAFIKT